MNENFEGLMAAGVDAHRHGNFKLALKRREAALAVADGDLEKGRAYRDLAATHGHLGDIAMASSFALDAFEHHSRSVEDDPTSVEAAREDFISTVYAGTYIARLLLEERESNNRELANLPETLVAQSFPTESLKALLRLRGLTPTNTLVMTDQYVINACRRISAMHTINGDRDRAVLLAGIGMFAGFWSESAHNPSTNPDLSTVERYKAKARAVGLSAGALALAGVYSSDTTHKPRQKIGNRLARIILR